MLNQFCYSRLFFLDRRPGLGHAIHTALLGFISATLYELADLISRKNRIIILSVYADQENPTEHHIVKYYPRYYVDCNLSLSLCREVFHIPRTDVPYFVSIFLTR